MPQNVEAMFLDPVSGKITTENNGSLFYFLKGTSPN